MTWRGDVYQTHVLTSNRHGSRCSMRNSFMLFPLVLETISQHKNVSYSKWILTYTSVYDSTMDQKLKKKSSLAGFIFEKSVKTIPKSNWRRVNEKQHHWLNPGEERRKVWASPVPLRNSSACKRRGGPWERKRSSAGGAPGSTAFARVWPLRVCDKWWGSPFCEDNEGYLYILASETLVLLEAFHQSNIMSWPQNFKKKNSLLKCQARGFEAETLLLSCRRRMAAWRGLARGCPRLWNTDSHPRGTLLTFCRTLHLLLVTWKHNFVQKYEFL